MSTDYRQNEPFKLIVCMVFSLIVLSALGTIVLAFFGDPQSQLVQSTLSNLGQAFTASVGALLGLIGGRWALKH